MSQQGHLQWRTYITRHVEKPKKIIFYILHLMPLYDYLEYDKLEEVLFDKRSAHFCRESDATYFVQKVNSIDNNEGRQQLSNRF
jgi:hypothetical protein